MKCINYFLLFILLFASCESEFISKVNFEETKSPIVVYPLNQEMSQDFSLKNIVKIRDLIILESLSDNQNILAKIDKAYLHEDRWYVADTKYSTLNVYSFDGSYIGQIGSLGEGPGKYLNINDFIIDKHNEQILVLSNDMQRVYYYDLNGKYLKIKDLNFFTSFFAKHNQEFVHYINFNYAKYNNNLLITNEDNIVEKTAFSFDPSKQNSGITFSGFLHDHGKNILFSTAFSDNIYTYVDEQISLKYRFDFGTKGISKEESSDFNRLFNNLINYSFLQNQVVESSQHLFYNFQSDSKINLGIYNKSTHKNYSFNRARGQDFLEKIISGPIGLVDNKFFICFIDFELYSYFKEEAKEEYQIFISDYPKISNKLDANINNINPALLSFEFIENEK